MQSMIEFFVLHRFSQSVCVAVHIAIRVQMSASNQNRCHEFVERARLLRSVIGLCGTGATQSHGEIQKDIEVLDANRPHSTPQ